ncbi:MAG: isoleucine--tRNA ligase [Saccharofermentanaceae bacterium]|jgi:isoleucyl-tRNA synthetase|nr:isoleucine--tRNA ligase [Clostridia bacterium]NLX68893.1 isoleucine--tRNA ligase [Clostridiaceae bacterium]HOO49404.1 isoleucine--tRNA ligase [Saccharofermentans sp.]HPE27868.1 isoleucine--tRNA ligase [Saccharofermentans sp.]HPQ31672.1 isoleucine--tRNA ligase [Saccharofermentans sp.]
MYHKVSPDMNFVDREKEVLSFWKSNDIQKKSIRPVKDNEPTFTLFDGPPTANGMPHIGHIKTRVIKDVVPRYHAMKGQNVSFKAGWDTHGLPVELEVEKMLGINGKPQIETYGVEPFIKQCKKSVWKYKDEWEQMSERVGFWADMENPYVTYDNNYIESEWWALKTIWDKGMLYKGHKIVPYCPRCGTALSSHEVAQGYKCVKENSVFVRFAVKGKENTYFAAWTTTPWTLPSNVALCVSPKDEYSLIKVSTDLDGSSKDVYYYMASVLVSTLFEEYETISTMKGTDMVGMEYVPLLPYATNSLASLKKKGHYIVSDSYVTMSDGTGIVHIAPAFGEDDARVGRQNDLPFVQLVNEDGTMPEDCDEVKGLFVKAADPIIVKKLSMEGKLLKKMPYEHDYPFCWRCDTPLIYYARSSWFIAMSTKRDELIKSNKMVNWYPESIRDGRMGNFLENVVDWGISRERYWGTPLPVWECECGHRHCIGSIEELKSMSDDCPEDIELHKPYVDNVHIKCEKCGGKMTRVSEVIDCWFDSGAMPFAQYHYPFENKEFFESHYPCQFISEALDQTRGWFYSLLAISTVLFEKSPFENCIVMGLVQDENGIKMSKHKGNVVNPWDILNKQGADAARWYFYSANAPWLPSRFSDASVNEGQRKFIGTYWNTYAFYIMYAQIDQFDPTKCSYDMKNLCAMDRWIISRLQSLIKSVDEKMSTYDITGSARIITDFTDELSNWYVRRCRERFWAGDMTKDKTDAFMTLYTVLESFTRLCAPFVPFVTESVYQNLVRTVNPNAPESVHMTDYPVCDESLIDNKLEEEMTLVQEIVVLGRAARSSASIKNRQPVSDIYVVSNRTLGDEYAQIVCDELNVRKISCMADASGLVDFVFKPQLRTCGRKFGSKLNNAKEVIASLPGKETVNKLKNGSITITVDGQEFELSSEDLLVETVQPEGLSTQSDKDLTVSINTVLTQDLIEDGLVREMISKIQTQRKETGLEVTDRINLYYSGNSKLGEVIFKNSDFIASETLAVSINEEDKSSSKEWDINSEKIYFFVEKA